MGCAPLPLILLGRRERAEAQACSPCCARCPGNPRRSRTAPGPLPAAQLCAHPSRGSPAKGRAEAAAPAACSLSTAAPFPHGRGCLAPGPFTVPMQRVHEGKGLGDTHRTCASPYSTHGTHLGDEDAQLRGLPPTDVEAQLQDKAHTDHSTQQQLPARGSSSPPSPPQLPGGDLRRMRGSRGGPTCAPGGFLRTTVRGRNCVSSLL